MAHEANFCFIQRRPHKPNRLLNVQTISFVLSYIFGQSVWVCCWNEFWVLVETVTVTTAWRVHLRIVCTRRLWYVIVSLWTPWH